MNSYGKTDIYYKPWIEGQTSSIYIQQITLWNDLHKRFLWGRHRDLLWLQLESNSDYMIFLNCNVTANVILQYEISSTTGCIPFKLRTCHRILSSYDLAAISTRLLSRTNAFTVVMKSLLFETSGVLNKTNIPSTLLLTYHSVWNLQTNYKFTHLLTTLVFVSYKGSQTLVVK